MRGWKIDTGRWPSAQRLSGPRHCAGAFLRQGYVATADEARYTDLPAGLLFYRGKTAKDELDRIRMGGTAAQAGARPVACRPDRGNGWAGKLRSAGSGAGVFEKEAGSSFSLTVPVWGRVRRKIRIPATLRFMDILFFTLLNGWRI